MASHLSNLLRRAGRWILLAELARAASAALGVLLGAVLLAMLIDAILALRPSWLIAVDCLLAATACGAALYVGWRLYRQLLNPRYLARLMETRAGIRDSRLINAVDFAGQVAGSHSGAVFVDESIHRGDSLATALSPRTALNLSPLRRAMAGVGIAALAALIIQLMLPGLFSAVTRRYLNPMVMHPPFTLLKFDVSITPAAVHHGKPATIKATISGPGAPERANVVFVDENQRGSQNVAQPMLRSDESTASKKQFELPIDRAENSRTFFIDAPGGRSELFTLEVLPTPTFEFLNVQYNFPAYTGWAPIMRALGSEGIKALEGTEIIISAGSNLPLRAGSIAVTRAEPNAQAMAIEMRPSPADPATVVGRFEVAASGRYDIVLSAADGTPSDEHRQGSIVAVPDRAPIIEITEPAQHVAVPEDYAVNVIIAARDDVGIDRITISRSVNGWGPSSVDLPLQRDGQTQTQPQPQTQSQAVAEYTFDLPQLGAKAGDVITYFATAHDNHPGGGQFTDTANYVIEVISDEEYMEYARTQYQMDEIAKEAAEFNRRLDELKAERDKLLDQLEPLKQKAADGQPLGDADLQKMRDLEGALKKYQEQAAGLAQDAKDRAAQQPLYEFEKPYQDTLKSLANDLQRQSDNAQQAADSMQQAQQQPGDSKACQNMGKAVEKFKSDAAPFDEQTQEQTKQTAQDMERLRLADDMVAQAERVRTVILQQRDLADRMAQFRDKDELNPADQLRAHRMAEEQDQLRDELQDARQKLKQASEKAQQRMPKMSGQAKKICQAIGEMDVDSDQARASQLAQDGLGREAHQAAEQAAQNLEKLLSDCNGQQMQEQASNELDGCLKLPKPGLRQSMSQLAQGRSIPGLGKKGGQGSGFAGSQARMMVMGPSTPKTGSKSDAKSGVTGRSDSTARAGAGAANGESPGIETLDPQSPNGRPISAAALAGVPVQFRDQAEAYFKRLAQEARKKRDDQ